MRNRDLTFHIAREAGLEFVFSSGQALRYPMHTHLSVFTVTLVRRGLAVMTRPQGRRVYGPGKVYVDAPGEPHSPAYSDNYALVSLCVDKSLCTGTGAAAGADRARLRALCARYAFAFVEQGALAAEEAVRLLDAVEALPAHGPDKLLAPAAFSAGIPDRDGAPLPEGMEEAGLSPWQFLRRFRAKTGLTPHQFLAQSRVRRAKHLLAGSCSLAEAAALAGFYDQSHLNRWFAACLGITPRAYREARFFLD